MEIRIVEPKVGKAFVDITGVTPLITNPKPPVEKLDGKPGVAERKEGKVAEFWQNVHWVEEPEGGPTTDVGVLAKGKWGFPAIAFKQSIVSGARFMEKMNMTTVRQGLFVLPDDIPSGLVVLEGPPPKLYEDIVRTAGIGRKASPRYRPMFEEWMGLLVVEYVESEFTPESIVQIVALGGKSGIGERRSTQKVGDTYGRYAVVGARIVEG